MKAISLWLNSIDTNKACLSVASFNALFIQPMGYERDSVCKQKYRE